VFVLHEEDEGWWAEWPYMAYTAAADTKEAVMDLCREGVPIITGRPVGYFTLLFVDGDSE
jgi:hypothetical protein